MNEKIKFSKFLMKWAVEVIWVIEVVEAVEVFEAAEVPDTREITQCVKSASSF